MYKLAMLAAVTAMTLAAGQARAAGEYPIRNLQATRLQVAQSCVDYHGFGLLTPTRDGQYGCYTRGGWIQCELDGSCTGARYDHYDPTSVTFARLPGVEGVLGSSHITRLRPRRDR